MPRGPQAKASAGGSTVPDCRMPNCGIAPEYLISPPRDALTQARPVGEAGVARAIGQALYRWVTAKAEIRGARGADWPAASLVAQIQQGTAVRVVDRIVVGRSPWLGV